MLAKKREWWEYGIREMKKKSTSDCMDPGMEKLQVGA